MGVLGEGGDIDKRDWMVKGYSDYEQVEVNSRMTWLSIE